MKTKLLLLTLICSTTIFAQAPSEPFSKSQLLQMNQDFKSKQPQTSSGLELKLDSIQVYNYSSWTQTWHLGPLTAYEYYPSGIVKSQNSITPEVFADSRVFHSDGRVDYHLYQQWTGFVFEDFFNTVYVYDANGHLLSDTNLMYDGFDWQVNGYSVYQTNAQGYIEEKISYSLTMGQSSPNYKFSFTNDANGNIQELVTYQQINGNWVYNYQYFYTYNADDRIEEFYYQSWDTANSVWQKNFRTAYTFVNDNQTLRESFTWMGSVWTLDSKAEYQFDNSVPMADVWMPEFMSENANMVIGSQGYFLDQGLWTYSDTTKYYYSQRAPSSIADIENETYYVLQTNPVMNEITILNKSGEWSDVQVYSTTGELVATQSSSSTTISMDVSDLKSGLYLVNISNANRRETLRVLVTH